MKRSVAQITRLGWLLVGYCLLCAAGAAGWLLLSDYIDFHRVFDENTFSRFSLPCWQGVAVVVGAFLGDRFWGYYRTSMAGSFIFLSGMAVMLLAELFAKWSPAMGWCTSLAAILLMVGQGLWQSNLLILTMRQIGGPSSGSTGLFLVLSFFNCLGINLAYALLV